MSEEISIPDKETLKTMRDSGCEMKIFSIGDEIAPAEGVVAENYYSVDDTELLFFKTGF